MVILSQPLLYNDRRSYYLNIRFSGMVVAIVHYVRILIDETTMNLMNSGLSSLYNSKLPSQTLIEILIFTAKYMYDPVFWQFSVILSSFRQFIFDLKAIYLTLWQKAI
jgi:hypothetical protein